MSESPKPRELPAMALTALSQGHKIEAIKVVRQEWGVDLKGAKDAVEAYVRTQPALAATMKESSVASQRGCITWLIVLVFLGVAVGYYLQRR